VYRAELMQFHGLWQDATSEAERARDWLSRPPIEPALGEAHYQQAELHRLRGDRAAAELDYREASRWGRRPDPGLALLRLAHGDGAAAAATIRRAMDEADDLTRPKLLEPCVEIMVALGQLDEARAAADELNAVAKRSKAPLLQAMAARSEATVRLAANDAREALAAARRASALWQGLDAPYEAARVRILVAEACRLLGDDDTARLELEEARRVFGDLGAAPDLARVSGLLDGKAASRNSGLSAREVEVLRLVAGGRTNRDIASELVISERTVDRHVSNIFAKLGVSTRSAATAHAYEHDLL
jgi:ATP/maltotriose-dependent transcriptional regulator MalT